MKFLVCGPDFSLSCRGGSDSGDSMLKYLIFLFAAIGSCLTPAARAAEIDDPLAQCLVSHSSEADRTLLMKWVYAIISSSPRVQALSTVSAAQREQLSADAGKLFSRLMITDCRSETIAALKNEGDKAVEHGFAKLGETAMTDLLGDPQVAKGMLGLLSGFDTRGLAELMIAAGKSPFNQKAH